MFVANGKVYVPAEDGKYAECTLYKQKAPDTVIEGTNIYYLEATTTTITELPEGYAVMTLQEIAAKFGSTASTPPSKSSESPGSGDEGD